MDEHTSEQMLSFPLDEDIDVSSRNAAFIDRSVEWIVSSFNVGAGTKIADSHPPGRLELIDTPFWSIIAPTQTLSCQRTNGAVLCRSSPCP
jgi:hypothetical protein